MTHRHGSIAEVLDEYGRRDAYRRWIEGMLALMLIFGLAAAGLAGADLAVRPGVPVRLVLLGAAVAAALVAACALAVRAALEPRRGTLAVEIESRSPQSFDNTLVTAVDCADADTCRRFGYSGELVEACRKRALEVAAGVDVASLAPFDRVQRLAIAVAALASIWAAIVLAAGPRVRDVLVVRYLALVFPSLRGPVTLDVKPGSVTVLEGSRLEVRLALTGRNVTEGGAPVLKRRVDGAVREETVALVPAGDNQFAALFASVLKPFRYRIEVGPFETPEYAVRVVPPPRIAKLVLSYKYPAYTALKDHVQDRPPYDVTGPIGTKVTVEVESSKPLASARLTLPGGPAALAKAGAPTKWTGTFELAASGQYSVEILDTDGFGNPSPERYQILAVTDRVPRVLVLEPGRDLSVKPSELTTLALKLDVADDYGLRRVALKAKLRQKVEYEYTTADEEHVIAAPTASQQKLAVDWTWDLSKRVLQPGDSIEYFIEAADHFPGKDGKPDPTHVGVSKTFVIRIPFAAEVMSKVSEEEDKELGSVEEIAARQKALDERVDKVLKDIKTQREVGYKERKELEQLAQKQKDIKDKAQDVSNRMKETLETLKKNDLVDPGAVKKLSEIQQLFNEIADSKMKENMERLKDLMQGMKMDPEKMNKLMAEFDKKKYSDQLERILKSLKRMKQQQELSRALKKMDELVKKQEKLKDDTAERTDKNRDTKDLAKQQDELRRDAESLTKQMPKLAGDMSAEFKENQEDLEKLSKEAQQQDPTAEMEQASSDLNQNKGQKAHQKQSEALQKMKKMQQAMKDVQEKVREKQQQIDLQALTALVAHGLRVSTLQEQVYSDASASASAPDMLRRFCLELAGRQYSALRGSNRFEKDFEQAFSDDVAFKNQFLAQIAQLIDDQTESKKNYEDLRLFSAKQLSERSLSRLNIILVKLLDAMSQLQDQQQSDGMQNFFDQMQKMIEGQRKLNEQTKRLKPGEQLSPFMQQMMQQMALEQEMIRKSMEQMAGKYEQAKQLLGDLDKLGKDMKAVEEALKKFDRTAETKDKQNSILERMLDMERSIHKKGKSEKRESEQAKTFTPMKAPALSQDLLEVKQKLHENLSRETYPPQHKKVVEDYFSSFGTSQ